MRVSSEGSPALPMTPAGGDHQSVLQCQVCDVQIRPGSRDGRPRLPSKVGLSTPGQNGKHDFKMMNTEENLFISTMICHNVTIFYSIYSTFCVTKLTLN